MRTIIDLDCGALIAAKEIVRAENTCLGKVISRLVRQALTGGAATQTAQGLPTIATATGFIPFESRGAVVSNDLINRLRAANGV